jgi:hypothetical protein
MWKCGGSSEEESCAKELRLEAGGRAIGLDWIGFVDEK